MGELNIHANIPNERFLGSSAQKAKEQEAQKQLVKQDPSSTTGIQWAVTQQMPQANTAQAAARANNASKSAADNNVKQKIEISGPSLEDVAMLSSAVSTKDDAVSAKKPGLIQSAFAEAINMGAMESAYRDAFKKSKSHNLLLERFMANVKFSAMKTLMGMMGMSGVEQAKIQAEVREKALEEIDSKIRNDWAYTKAMMEITQG